MMMNEEGVSTHEDLGERERESGVGVGVGAGVAWGDEVRRVGVGGDEGDAGVHGRTRERAGRGERVPGGGRGRGEDADWVVVSDGGGRG